MKQIFTTIVIVFSSIFASAQSFDGVPISGDLPTAISKFKAKGYTLVKYLDNGAKLTGSVAFSDVEVYLSTTPKSKKVFKCTIYFNERATWSNLKSDYKKYYEILVEKYGLPDNKLEKFDSPYYEGDGYEMTAVGIEKCSYFSLWLRKDNLNIGLFVSKFKQVEMIYENVELIALKDRELAEMQNKSF